MSDTQNASAPEINSKPAASTADQATSPKATENKPGQQRRQRPRKPQGRSGNRKDGEATTSKTEAPNRQRYQRRERPSDEPRQENLSNVLTIGTRLPVNAYVRLVKYVLNTDKHETLELWGYRDGSMAHLTEVVNVLTRWNYV